MLANLLPLSFLDTYSRSMSSLRCKALCIVMSFLVLWSTCWSFFSSTLRIVSSILRRRRPRCLSLWWDSCYIIWFRVVFSFSWDILFNFFLSSPLVSWCPLPVFLFHGVRVQYSQVLALSRHFSLSFITSGGSSGLHLVSSHSCCIYVRTGRPDFAWPYAGVHKSTSFMNSSLLLSSSVLHVWFV